MELVLKLDGWEGNLLSKDEKIKGEIRSKDGKLLETVSGQVLIIDAKEEIVILELKQPIQKRIVLSIGSIRPNSISFVNSESGEETTERGLSIQVMSIIETDDKNFAKLEGKLWEKTKEETKSKRNWKFWQR